MPTYLYEEQKTGRTVELFRRIEERDEVPPALRRIQCAPAFRKPGGTPDPTSADVAVPRAFRQLEQTVGAAEIARQSGFSVKKIKSVWNFKN